MPHMQRQQVDSRGQRALSPHLLPPLLLLLLSSLALQPSQAAIQIPPGYHITELGKPPVITAQPDSITVFGAEDIALTCQATGNPPPTFRWTRDGEEFVPADDPGLKVSKSSGSFAASGSSMVGLGPMKQYQGKYTCYASNPLGTAVSNQVTLMTDQPPALQKEKKVRKTAVEGESVVLKCNPPISSVEPVIHWMDNQLRHLQLSERVMLGKDGNMYFAHVTVADSRNDYTCNAQYLAARTILPKEPITLTVTPSNSVVRNRRPQMMSPTDTHSTYHTLRGQTLELDCIVQGLPTPSVQWIRKDGEMSESRVSRDQFDRRLRFHNISESDGGEYQCIATNTQGKVKHTYTVTVEAAPYWTREPVSQVYAPGETVRLDCQADGIPSPTVSWSINGIPLADTDVDSRRSVQGGVLILADVQFEDTAVYQCRAHNTHGTILTNTNVFVIELPPQILTEDGQSYTVIEGQKAELVCHSFGSPRPQVSWASASAPYLLADPRVNLLTNGGLQISNVTHGDAGTYTCSVDDTSLNITAQLEVLKKTVILSPPMELRVQPGQPATFTCEAEVDPKLSPPHYQWRRNGQKIFQSSAEDKYTLEGGDLMVSGVTTEDEGVYTCEVITKLDMAEASGSITVVDRPGPPTLLLLQGADPADRSITLSWTPGDDHNSPVIEYLVEFEDQRSEGRGWEELKRVGGTREKALLRLQPYMSLHFRVTAINDVGPSDPSVPSDLHSTPAEAPDDNPEDVRSESTDPNTLLITWEEMEGRNFNGPEFRYQVFWRRVEGAGPTWLSNFTTAPPYIVSAANFSAYEIKVQAVNQVGEGPEPDPVIGYSGEDVPLDAPMDVGVEILNSTAVKVIWAPVDRKTVRGHLLGCKIRLTRLGSRGRQRGRRAQGAESTVELTTGAAEQKRLIGGLRPYSHYALTVAVFNSKGEGPPSDSLPFSTDEGAPGPPGSLHLESPGETVMELRWSPPAQPNGVLTGYLLQYQQIVQTDDSPMQVETIGNHTATHTTLKGLDPASRYRFYLRGRTSAGDGEPIIREGATTLDGAPPDNISLSVGDKTVNLSWVSKERHRSVGFHVLYLNKKAGGKWKQSEKVDSSRSSYVLQGLTPGTQYRLKFTFNNHSFYETEIQTEGTGVTDLQSNFATQGWFIGLVSAIVMLLLLLLLICFVKRSKGGKYSVKDKEEGQVDSEARPMKDETFGEYSDNEEKRTASQPSLCDDSKLCTSEDNLDEYNGTSAITEVNMDASLASQYSRGPSDTPDPGPVPESSPLNPPGDGHASNGLPNSAAILDDILTSLTLPGLDEQNMSTLQ